MKHYILRNKEMPWGDYGSVLFAGFLNVMDKNYDDLEFPELERTGSYIPEIYITNSRNIVAVDSVKKIIEQSDIKGIKGFKHVVKKKIVNIDWLTWDKEKDDPQFYPKSGEPEDYILKGENDSQLASSMPDIWELDILKKYKLKKGLDKTDNIAYSDIALAEDPILDIFIPENMLFLIVSEKFKELLELNSINTLRFIEVQKTN